MAKWRSRLTGSHARLAAYLFVVVVGTYGLYVTNRNTHDIQQTQSEQQYSSCLTGNDTRSILADLIALSSQRTPVDYTKIPSFNNLDGATKQFLVDVSNASNTSLTQDQIRQFVKERLPPRDCEALRGR